MRYIAALNHYSKLLREIGGPVDVVGRDGDALLAFEEPTIPLSPRAFQRDRMAKCRSAARQRRLHRLSCRLRRGYVAPPSEFPDL